MCTNYEKISENVRVFCKKVNGEKNKCFVVVELLDNNGMEYSLEIRRSKILGNSFTKYLTQELNEYDIELTKEDIDKIADKVKGALKTPVVNLNGKIQLGELLHRLYQAAQSLQVSLTSQLCTDGKYLYIRHEFASDVQEVLNDHGGAGWKQLEFKKKLKLRGFLVTNKTPKDDSYVYSMYSLGNSKVNKGEPPMKFLKIRLDMLVGLFNELGIDPQDKIVDDSPEGYDKEAA